jgi:hypothetical protein
MSNLFLERTLGPIMAKFYQKVWENFGPAMRKKALDSWQTFVANQADSLPRSLDELDEALNDAFATWKEEVQGEMIKTKKYGGGLTKRSWKYPTANTKTFSSIYMPLLLRASGKNVEFDLEPPAELITEIESLMQQKRIVVDVEHIPGKMQNAIFDESVYFYPYYLSLVSEPNPGKFYATYFK